jgi:DNA-binding response OmpR family regulator
VVEDEPALGDLLREFLEAKGCRVTLAGAGRTALDELARRPYDVVLVDLLLPGASGWDIARAGKRHSPRTAVILMSGEMNPENLWADGQAIDAAVTKPLDLRKLLRVIAQVASRRSPHQVE